MPSTRRAICALTVMGLVGCGGDEKTDRPAAAVVACGDGADNDGDGLVDAADPGCGGERDPDEGDPPLAPACANGTDDDGDGLVDLADSGCVGESDGDETDGFSPACANGTDDDGDGLVDQKDPGCRNASDTTEGHSACTNGLDDDGDWVVDLRDPDCLSTDDDFEGTTLCNDRLDNDGDGLRDWADPGCIDGNDVDETDPAVPSACSNGIDDDGDGRKDWPADPGCRGLIDNLPVYSLGFGYWPGGPGDDDERGPMAPCDNGFDDDGDGVADFPDDPDCYDPFAPEAPLTACDDYVDNDADGARDLEDPGCTGPGDEDETDPPGGTACTNGLDDDGDGRIDVGTEVDWRGMPIGGDPGCASASDTDERNRFGAGCDNGLDDDGDGHIDFPADSDCTSTGGTEFAAPIDACRNGLDDDGDGAVDAFDPGCDTLTDSDETDPSEAPVCANGLDDDGDGLADYPEDPGCPRAADTSERERIGAECDNTVDDDGDGAIDYPDDPDCAAAFGTETPRPVFEIEPNETPDMAQPLLDGMRVQGCIDLDWGDLVDWFVVDLVAGEILTVDLTESCEMDSSVFVYDGVPADPGGDICDPLAPAPAVACESGMCPVVGYTAVTTGPHTIRVVPSAGWSYGCYILGVTVE